MDWQKRHCIKTSQYFPKPFRNFVGNINSKLICLIMQQNQILKIF